MGIYLPMKEGEDESFQEKFTTSFNLLQYFISILNQQSYIYNHQAIKFVHRLF